MTLTLRQAFPVWLRIGLLSFKQTLGRTLAFCALFGALLKGLT